MVAPTLLLPAIVFVGAAVSTYLQLKALGFFRPKPKKRG